ncbi:DNA internalization-related competence protein ComEC/Rec2 [Alteromonas sp. ZYF713]|nr:DNA internalization-related competence protein ComEC/Rec2 [Alteromonas sp. ZYF713]
MLTTAATAFSGAVISGRWWSELPHSGLPLVLAFISLLATALLVIEYCNAKRWQKPLCFAWVAMGSATAGLFVATSVGQSYLKWQQLGGEIQQDVIIEGRVVGYQRFADYDRLILTGNIVDQHVWDKQWAIQLHYYRAQAAFTTGQRIRTAARIKPARAIANPTGFDMQRWYVSQRIVKTGYVRGHRIALIEPDTSTRNRLKSRLTSLKLPGEKWLLALLFGERQEFTKSDWQLLQQTGTAHLFAISGLHLMIVAGAILFVFRSCIAASAWLTFSLPKSLYLTAFIFVLATCGFYAYLADWQTAVLRAYCALLIIAVLHLLKLRLPRLTLVLLTLSASILLDPMAVYGAALYLSVGAVAIIIWFHWWWENSSRGGNWIRGVVLLQLMLSVLMAPLVGALLGQVSLISPLINLLIVPVMSLLVIPLCLLGLFMLIVLPADHPITAWVLQGCGKVLEWLMQQLEQVASFVGDYAAFPVFTSTLLVASVIALLLILAPPFKGRLLLLVVTLLGCAGGYLPVTRKTEDWQVHIFDVGQGNATLISRNSKAILFDTGASFTSGFNFVETVIRPFLQIRGMQLERVFISHFDNDHAGGLDFIRKTYPELAIVTPKDNCHAGGKWQWQGLNIQALWPLPDSKVGWSDNDGSCVIKISDGRFSMLVPGDIEQKAEHALLSLPEVSQALTSNIILAPHHGSKTSSSTAFIEQVKPQFVVFSQGWLNRWGFPHQQVVERYRNVGSQALFVSESGYLRFDIIGEGISTYAYRESQHSRWYHKTFVKQ